MDFEKLREQRRRLEADLEKFNRQQALEEQEIYRMRNDLQNLKLSPGHQSEPTTPPEYRDQVFPSIYSRRNRYSSSSLVSPPGLNNRLSRSGSQVTSPPNEPAQSQQGLNESDKLPSKSVPGSRRGSNDRVSSYITESGVFSQRSAAKYVSLGVPFLLRYTNTEAVLYLLYDWPWFCDSSAWPACNTFLLDLSSHY